jgi:putative hydrolase of the HAD superfamily
MIMNNIKAKKIKNFVFDFGGVLYEISPEPTFEGFKAASSKQELFISSNDMFKKYPIFGDYEIGKISSREFRRGLIEILKLNIDDDTFDAIWNKSLIDLRNEAIAIAKKFKTKGKLFLLSNTNEIHYNHFIGKSRELFVLFEKRFFSHLIGMNKPNKKVYRLLVKDSGIIPQETLFIDDSEINIKAAESEGFQTYLYKIEEAPGQLLELL